MKASGRFARELLEADGMEVVGEAVDGESAITRGAEAAAAACLARCSAPRHRRVRGGGAAVAVVAGNPYTTVAFALGLVALSAYRYVAGTGPERRARLAPLTAAVALGLVLVADSIARLAGVGTDLVVLFAYDLTVCLIAIGLTADPGSRRNAPGGSVWQRTCGGRQRLARYRAEGVVLTLVQGG